MRWYFAVPALAALSFAAGCSSGSQPLPEMQTPALRVAPGQLHRQIGNPIKHVVIVIQENRSFDNVFAGFPGADTKMHGYMHDGTKVLLEPIAYQVRDMNHDFRTGVMDWDNGKMDGFDLNGTSGTQTIGRFAYSYLERSQVQPYWTIASRYVLADHMFPTMFGPSYTAHLTLIAGSADIANDVSEADFPSASPWGCDAPAGTQTATVNVQRVVSDGGPFPCLTRLRTMADTLDAAHLSWKYYAPAIGTSDSGQLWSSFDAISSVRYGPDWSTHVVSPPQQVIADAKAGRLAAVSWVVPDFLWSDHPYAGTDYGPSWVAGVINAIGQSPAWKSTAIVVVWDDWGGFYDNVPPPQRDFRGLGIRVGCLIVSPYVRPHVSHTVYEFGS
ncbi:MAG TPA: alkaline phosphatase family protein, partial [Candidatus Baltobacteraceae bacterium]|nr:alkaline phosphatase family protein [Candidatus Baltobacteraceae bacterium]